MNPPNTGKTHHCSSSFQDIEKPIEQEERRKRNKRVCEGGLWLTITYRR
jgi:hypothetical protein